MTYYSSQTFHSKVERGTGATFENLAFERCTFINCGISYTTDVAKRPLVRNIRLEKCSAINCGVGPAILENVVVDGLATNDLLIFWGTLFKNVTIKGDIGDIKINKAVHHVDCRAQIQSPFDSARSECYDNLDWALDIREARFQDFDLQGIPANLVRRDPETQVIVRRQKALQGEWRENISPSNTYWPFVIDMFLQDGDPDIVLVVPKGKSKKKFAALLDELNELRHAGIVEPD